MSHDQEDTDSGSIAIVGLAGRFPSAKSATELWALLREGKTATQWMTETQLREAGVSAADLTDPDYVRASMVLPDMEMFDAGFFGFSKRDASVLDPQHRHFLECAWEALEDAGHMPARFPGAIGVFAGCGMQAYLAYNLLSNPALVKSMGTFLLRHTGNDKDFLTTRLSYLLDLKGPSMSIQTACSTSLVAVHVASQSLLSGECDMALAGGVSIEVPHRRGYQYAQGEILSSDGYCRAFDENANGTVFGSGVGVVVLRRLADALRDRDNIYGVIRGSAVNNDGSQKAGYLAPSVDGQASAAAEALAVAGVDASSVSYIEAHGTGTPVGDPIEVAALAQAYGSGGVGFCGIGSLKTNIGHLDTAAGVASLIKVCLALRHGLIPASLNFTQPNTRFEIAKTPFFVVSGARPWMRGSAPRRAAVNSLGVGGTNAHVIVEEAPAIHMQTGEPDWQTLVFSARSAASLEALKKRWLEFLATPPPGFRIEDAAFTTQEGREPFEHRLAIVARDVSSLYSGLEARNHVRVVSGQAGRAAPDAVLMFPGGGAHYPGAGRDLLGQPGFARAIDECFRMMPGDAPEDLRAAMFDGLATDPVAVARLERPAYAIPALFTLEYALAKLWESWGVRPAAVIGHSAGEYAAACIAGVMTLHDALSIVVLRGKLFELAPSGVMLSIDLPEADLLAMMQGLDVDVAAVNAPDLCIASGSLQAIGQLEQRLAERGIEGRRLRINVAAHSRLLDGVLEIFRERMGRVHLSPPLIPFISNLTGTWVDAQTLTEPEYWTRHLRQPVRFSQGLERLADMAQAVLIEAGPGQGLCALARHNSINPDRCIVPSTCKAQDPAGDLAQILTSVAAFWTRGGTPLWENVRGNTLARRISLPSYAFDHQRYWIVPGVLPQESAIVENAPLEERPAQRQANFPELRRLPSHDDWFLRPAWKPAPITLDEVATGRWLVFGNDARLTADLLAQLSHAGHNVTLVLSAQEFSVQENGSFTVSPSEPDHFYQLFALLERTQSLPDQIAHLWSLDTMPDAGAVGISGQHLTFNSLASIAKALQQLDITHAIRLTVITGGSHAVSGEAVPHPERALALGACRVIPNELANVTTRLVDFPALDTSPTFLAGAIMAECTAVHDHDLVAYRGNERWGSHLVPVGQTPGFVQRSRLKPNAVYLITGGLGDIALELAMYLATMVKARLALVSRRELPPRALWRALAASPDQSPNAVVVRQLVACEDRGAEVLVLRADVSDRQAMLRVVSECRARFGTINGVFHAAGTIEDGLIATKSAESIQRVLNAKAFGAQVLHELLPAGALDFFAMFSSTSVYLGAAGQMDYAAANAFLDALAASRPDGLSIHWGVWGDRGMAARAYGYSHNSHYSNDSQGDSTAGESVHPLLGRQTSTEGGATFEATYSPNSLWVLNEHVVAGRPVLPGTGYIEIARAAMAVLHPGKAIEIRALSFEEAMVFDARMNRLVSVQLQSSANGYDFVVRSRGKALDAWQQHARANVGLFGGEEPLPLADEDAAALTDAPWQVGKIAQEEAASFGERWHNIQRMKLGEGCVVAEMALPERFYGDLNNYALHPAITDMGATLGLHLIDKAVRADNLFVPISIDRIRLFGPLGGKAISRVQSKGDTSGRLAVFDATFYGMNGTPLAIFEGFSMRGVKPQVVTRQSPSQPPHEFNLTEAILSCGIRAEDSHVLFSRILFGDERDMVVSSISLTDLKNASEALSHRHSRKTGGEPAQTVVAPAPGDESLTPVEALIAGFWCDLLGVDHVNKEDDFFALGGHSLAAVRLFARIRKQFSVELPLATLFQAPTLANLAAVVSESGGMDTTEAAEVLKKISSDGLPATRPPWSPLVMICRGEASRRPLFCVHGAGGNVLNFKIISDKLGVHQPFYGLQAQGVDGRLPPLTTVEAMAAQYVEAMRSVDAVGPYRLAGYSAGGVIALEMAQQLCKAGAEVQLLAMIDSLSPTHADQKVSYFRKLLLIRHWSLDFALGWHARRSKWKALKINYAIALEKLSRGESLPPELVDFHLFQTFLTAQANYKPAAYDGSLLLFKATLGETQFMSAGPALGWDSVVKGNIRVVTIKGTHFSMMSEPAVLHLIGGLSEALASTDASGSAGASASARTHLQDPSVSSE